MNAGSQKCWLILIGLIAAMSAWGTSMNSSEQEKKAQAIREWRGIVPGKSSVADVARILESAGTVIPGGQCKGVDGMEVRNFVTSSGDPLVTICFAGGRVAVVNQLLSFIDAPKAEKSKDYYVRRFGEPAQPALRSRAGKAYDHLVWPQYGFALDVKFSRGRVKGRRLFEPTTWQHYIDYLYREPGPFIK